MDAARQLTGKCLVHQAVAFEPALSTERFRYNIDPEMGFAARPMSGMSDMLVGFVDYVETLRREGFTQLFADEITGRHE